MNLTAFTHLNFDDAWSDAVPVERTIDAREWGPKLRFSAPPRLVEQFDREISPALSPFLLYGSGDFHHLSALWLRRVTGPVVLVSFDNHPDWDIRPPRWGCGSWVNRALELPHVQQVSVWGCGNFECWWPGNIFGNRRAERSGRLEVHPWADGRSAKDQARRGAILRENWRERFRAFAQRLAHARVYVTIDLDCLRREEAITNWENGRFTCEDVQWALSELRSAAEIVAGDICGAFSPSRYARRKQRFASEMDHPKIALPPPAEIAQINEATLAKIAPFLAG